jgi:hypothetical protein
MVKSNWGEFMIALNPLKRAGANVVAEFNPQVFRVSFEFR